MNLETPKIKKGFLARVEQILGPGAFSVRNLDRLAYSRDSNFKAAIQARYGKFNALPDLIAWPSQVSQVQELVRLAARNRVPIVPYGAGSGVCGGSVPSAGSMVVDMKRMHRIVKLDADALKVTAETGILGLNLEEELSRRGYTLGHFPSSIGCASLGGYLAARSAGQASSRYGKIEDMVRDLEVVTGTGELVQTRDVSHARGLDLNHVFLGSEGVLGLMTKATLKIHPKPEKTLFRGIRFTDMKTGMEAMRRIMQSGLKPAVLRLYDELDSLIFLSSRTESGGRKLPDIFGALARNLKYQSLKTLLLMPQAFNALTRLIPSGCLLILQHEGAERIVAEEQKICREISLGLGGEDLGEAPGIYWNKHRYSVAYNASPLFHAGAFTDTIEVATTWERMLALYQGMVRALSNHAMVMAHLSHVYTEGGSLYFTFVAPMNGLKKSEELYDFIWDRAMRACQRLGGVISHHHGVGKLKAKYMGEEWGDGLELLKAFKQAYDPQRILNPGKLFIETKAGKAPKKRAA